MSIFWKTRQRGFSWGGYPGVEKKMADARRTELIAVVISAAIAFLLLSLAYLLAGSSSGDAPQQQPCQCTCAHTQAILTEKP